MGLWPVFLLGCVGFCTFLIYIYVASCFAYAGLYARETILFKTLASSYRMGFITWGGVFAVLLVMAIIAGLIQLAASAPWYIVTMVEYVFSLMKTQRQSLRVSVSTFYQASWHCFCSSDRLSDLFIYSGMGYQFGHASVKSQEIKVTDQIDSF